MKNRFMRGAALGLAMVTAFTFTAPNSALLSAEAAAKQATAATKITAKAASVKVGKTAKVKVTINKKATKKVTINVKAKNAKIAKVAKKLTIKKGKKAATLKVKGLKKGSTKLTLSFKNSKGKTVKKTIKVTVKKAAAAKVAATGVTLDKTAYTVGLGQSLTMFATPVPANTTDKATWTSSDETVATVADGVVTGVKEGKATITVAYNENATATAEVTVSKDAIIYNLTAAKQVAANKVELTFDNPEAKNLTQKTDVVVSRKDGTQVLAVDSFAWSADGTTAITTLQTNFADKVDYTIAFKEGTPIDLTASVGAIASAAILTTTAEKNVETKIDYAFYDANGMDVTTTVGSTANVSIDVNGGSSSDTSNYRKATVTLANIGDTAEVTITYNSGATGADDIKGTGIITCVDNVAVVGKGIFKSTGNLNKESECAKFYLSGMSDSNIKVEVDETKSDIYFYAAGEDGKAIKYDSYEVSSSADDTMTAEVNSSYDSDSKFTVIEVKGNKTGSAVINVTAIKNDKATPYTIPVTVVDKKELSQIEVKLERSTISNAYDEEYSSEISVKAKDKSGNYFDAGDVSIKLNDDSVNDGGSSNVVDEVSGDTATIDKYGFRFGKTANNTGTSKVDLVRKANGNDDEYHGYYTAWGAKGGTYKMDVTVSYEGKTIEKTVSVKVDALTSDAWIPTKGVAFKYEIELDDSKVDEANPLDNNTTVRLRAMAGSKFAGYVRGADTVIGAISATAGTFETSAAAAKTVTVDTPAAVSFRAASIGSNRMSSNSGSNDISLDAVTVGAAKITAPTAITGAAVVAAYGAVFPDNWENALVNVKPYVRMGSKYSNGNANNLANLYDWTKVNSANYTKALETISPNAASLIARLKINTVNEAAGMYYVPSDKTLDEYFAQTGSYTVTYEYSTLKEFMGNWKNYYNGDKSETKKTTNLTVNNSIFVPSVSYNTKNVDSISVDDIKEVLVTNVDLNNNDSEHKSVEALYKNVAFNSGKTAVEKNTIDVSNSSTTVKYVAISERIAESSTDTKNYTTPIDFIVNLGQQFYEAK